MNRCHPGYSFAIGVLFVLFLPYLLAVVAVVTALYLLAWVIAIAFGKH